MNGILKQKHFALSRRITESLSWAILIQSWFVVSKSFLSCVLISFCYMLTKLKLFITSLSSFSVTIYSILSVTAGLQRVVQTQNRFGCGFLGMVSCPWLSQRLSSSCTAITVVWVRRMLLDSLVEGVTIDHWRWAFPKSRLSHNVHLFVLSRETKIQAEQWVRRGGKAWNDCAYSLNALLRSGYCLLLFTCHWPFMMSKVYRVFAF